MVLLKSKQYTLSNYICDWILDLGIGHLFLIPGSQIDPFTRSVVAQNKLKPIVACHELGAGFMAQGYANAMNIPGICVTIGGPGATFVLPSANISRIDNSSVLYITGEPPTQLKDFYPFQDTGVNGSRDIALFSQAIDSSFSVDNSSNIEETLNDITIRLQKYLPCHLAIPYNLQEKSISSYQSKKTNARRISNNDINTAESLAKLINASQGTVLLVGNRMNGRDSGRLLTDLIEKTQILVATTFGAKGIVSENHKLSLGNFGYAGTPESHKLMLEQKNNLLIVAGTHLGQRETLYWDKRLKTSFAQIVHVDTRESVNTKSAYDDTFFGVDDISETIKSIIGLVNKKESNDNIPLKIEPEETGAQTVNPLKLSDVLVKVRKMCPDNSTMVVDSGSHRTVAGLHWKAVEPNTFFTSETMAPMGWAICASIGIQLAKPEAPVLVLTGDGCMRMHGNEIATAVRYQLPIIYLISNNANYAGINVRLETNEEKELLGELPLINWCDFARSLGARGEIIESIDQLEGAILKALGSHLPTAIDLRISLGNSISSSSTIPKLPWPDFKE